MRANYKNAIAWVAVNDEPHETDLSVTEEMITVALIADVWGKTCEEVAKDVLKARKKAEGDV